jgi:hypothetical protein
MGHGVDQFEVTHTKASPSKKGGRDRENARQPEGPTGEREGRPHEDTAGRRNEIGYSGQIATRYWDTDAV